MTAFLALQSAVYDRFIAVEICCFSIDAITETEFKCPLVFWWISHQILKGIVGIHLSVKKVVEVATKLQFFEFVENILCLQ